MRRSPLALLDPLGDTSFQRVDRDRDACRNTFAQSLLAAPVRDTPYRHWLLHDVLPLDMAAAMDALPFPAPALNGVSGSREIHNNTRRYVDARRDRRSIRSAAAWPTPSSTRTPSPSSRM